jgi:imidazole glycerol-phosphate synthase subunit HisH
MIAIIDYGAGNIHNVQSILEYLGEDVIVTSDPKDLESADRIILPGVGAFGFIMSNLRKKKLDIAILHEIKKGKPFLGVCLGFQVMFEDGEETPGVKGLGIFKGSVVKFRKGKVPHVGWNDAKLNKINMDKAKSHCPKFKSDFAYFVHSYYPKPKDKKIILFETVYGEKFCSGVIKDNVIGVQFHPERSGKWGIEFYRQWLNTRF